MLCLYSYFPSFPSFISFIHFLYSFPLFIFFLHFLPFIPFLHFLPPLICCLFDGTALGGEHRLFLLVKGAYMQLSMSCVWIAGCISDHGRCYPHMLGPSLCPFHAHAVHRSSSIGLKPVLAAGYSQASITCVVPDMHFALASGHL